MQDNNVRSNWVPDPSASARDDSATRPERRFERRRLLIAVVIGVFVLAVCGFEVRGCLNPTLGMQDMLSATVKVTATSIVNLPQSGVVTVFPSPTVRRGNFCRVVDDIVFDSGVIPASSLVSLVGSTRAGGGMVNVVDFGWTSASNVDCDFDLLSIEMRFVMTPTTLPTILPTALPTQTPLRVYVSAPTLAPLPTYTPYPDLLGIYRDASGCWRFSVAGVREIWVGKTPVAGGDVVCDVREFRVVVK